MCWETTYVAEQLENGPNSLLMVFFTSEAFGEHVTRVAS